MVKLPGLRRLRLLAALTQQELATKTGIDRSQISRFENGFRASARSIRKLATALRCMPADLIEKQKEY